MILPGPWPSRHREHAPVSPAAATPHGHERWRILDEVELPGEPFASGRPQRGVIERLLIDEISGLLWVRLQGGPRGGTLLVVDAGKVRRPATLPFIDFRGAP